MIANWSRLSQYGKCPEKAWNWDERHLETPTPEINLHKGTGFHAGAAHFFANKDARAAEASAEEAFRRDLEGKVILPEERADIEHAIAWTKLAVGKFAEQYQHEPVQVLWPEVQFCVPMPKSEHTCWEFHRRYCGGVPFQEHVLKPHGTYIPSQMPACFQPHYFRGKTDAVVQYLGDIWLMEHKTNSVQLEMFVQRFFLDAQDTGYLYGIWKSTGVLPAGFLLNVIQKPHPNSKNQMQVGFAREMFLRSQEDLEDFAAEFVTQANQYEQGFRDRSLGQYYAIARHTTACVDYGRKCPYFAMCQRHPREPLENEFIVREADYVELAYEEIYTKWKEQHCE